MNPDRKELAETIILALVTLVFGGFCVLCVKWGASYQVLMAFSGLTGTALGALGMKMKASTNGNGNGHAQDLPPALPAPSGDAGGKG